MTSPARWIVPLLLLAGCARADAPPPAPSAPAAAPAAPAPGDPLDAIFADTTAPWPPDDSIREKVGGTDGVIVIVHDSARGPAFRVYVNGGEVLADSLARGVRLLAVTQSFYPRVVAVLEVDSADAACGTRYRVLDAHGERPPLLTPSFGGCGRPRISFDDSGLRMDFASAGTARPAEAYEYRDTTLARLASGRAPRQVLSAARGEGEAWRTPWSERRSRLPGRLVTADGAMEITRGPMQGERPSSAVTVSVDGRALLSEEFAMAMEVYALVPPTPAHGTLVVLLREDGGNACEGLFRVVEMRRGRAPRVTDEFGSCAVAPDVFTADGGLRMEFAPWWTHYQEADPAFRPPPGQAFAYRAGRMARVSLSPASAARWAR